MVILYENGIQPNTLGEITDVAIREAGLMGADFSGMTVKRWDVSACNLSGARFAEFSITETSARLANLRSSQWRSGVIESSDFLNSHLDQAKLVEVTLRGTRMARASMHEARLAGCVLEECDLSGIALRGSVLEDVTLRNVNLRGADLRDVDLGAVRADKGTFSEAILE